MEIYKVRTTMYEHLHSKPYSGEFIIKSNTPDEACNIVEKLINNRFNFNMKIFDFEFSKPDLVSLNKYLESGSTDEILFEDIYVDETIIT